MRMLALVAGLLAGCVFVRAAMSSEDPPLPRYMPGDNFTYNDGRTETVISVSGEVVRWRDDLGFVFPIAEAPAMKPADKFSSTVRRWNMRRPSGQCPMPLRAMR